MCIRDRYGLYVKLMAERWFPKAGEFAAKPLSAKLRDGPGLRELFAQVAIDQLVHVPFVFFPCYYITKTAIMGDGMQPVIPTAMKKWRRNLVEDVKASWQIWIPCNFVNFGFMPMHLRIPFMACCSMAFCIVLSSMRGGKQVTPEADRIRKEARKVDRQQGELLQEIMATNREEAQDGISKDSFKGLMHRLGISDDDALEGVFDAWDLDGNQRVSLAALSTLLLAVQAPGNATRTGLVFDCCDTNCDGKLSRSELCQLIRGMIAIREAVLLNGGEPSSEQSMDLLAGGAGVSASDTASRRESRRLELMAKRGGLDKEVSLAEILTLEAEALAGTVLEESGGSMEHQLSRDEFERWVESGSNAAVGLMGLFDAFESS
eukprot:TRINITY_DN31360_c0_g1_i1.p1 TRINITY_DN31360_c0_g1~~TRINITY_DN31360_c0_g1_i1.p1  ORF type:complete len:376 (+),score=106.47 TRINITY_DN31360_c0_g1_i1:166-1293(+)